jgi:hypothetical protein
VMEVKDAWGAIGIEKAGAVTGTADTGGAIGIEKAGAVTEIEDAGLIPTELVKSLNPDILLSIYLEKRTFQKLRCW